MGHIFFENEQGVAVTVNGDPYSLRLQEFWNFEVYSLPNLCRKLIQNSNNVPLTTEVQLNDDRQYRAYAEKTLDQLTIDRNIHRNENKRI